MQARDRETCGVLNVRHASYISRTIESQSYLIFIFEVRQPLDQTLHHRIDGARKLAWTVN